MKIWAGLFCLNLEDTWCDVCPCCWRMPAVQVSLGLRNDMGFLDGVRTIEGTQRIRDSRDGE
jgi:hypothetical protein